MAARPRILVVDDEAEIREILLEVLELDGYAVDTAVNGADALERIAQHPDYAAILSDMLMPKMDGLVFYQECGRRWPTLVPRFLFMAAITDAQAMVPGATVIAKPFDLDAIRRILRGTIEQALMAAQPPAPNRLTDSRGEDGMLACDQLLAEAAEVVAQAMEAVRRSRALTLDLRRSRKAAEQRRAEESRPREQKA